MNLIKASLKYKQVTITVLLLLFIVGVNSLLNMPRREDPKITIRQGLVIAAFPGATSAQVENQVTHKLEQYLFQFEEIRKSKTYSTTEDGLVVVNVELNENVKAPDVFWNKLRHQLLVAKQIDFPQGVRGPVVNSDFGDTEAMIIGIESDDASYEQLKGYAEKVEDYLRKVPAGSKIKRIGEQREQVVVTASSQKLAQYGLSLNNVSNVLQSQNAVTPTGYIKNGNSETPIYSKGTYNTEQQVANQVIGTSGTGEVVHLGDIAKLERGYSEPTSKITVNGHKAIMISMQMQEGNNIVKFGKEVKEKLDEASALLPSNVKLTTIVNQPHVVDENISHFIHEFFLAIISVVIVVILLLPFRIAAVAAMAIPMTIAVTFALMQAFGIELHQVSLAALIVVLGMVVDDAIVIADNYVELLDKGVDRWTAAWRSAADLILPVFGATITIIASFLPLVILNGSVGEFIRAMPITVAISLSTSFIVALLFTPLLCYAFIKKGLHNPQEEGHKQKKKSLLDRMQSGYDSLQKWCVQHPKLTIVSSFIPVALAVLLFTNGVRQKFFPAAERNQFVVELWMPTATQLSKTEQAILKVQHHIQSDKRVTSFATFIGTSASRFYYNFNPEFPVTNYAQILINTGTEEEALKLSEELTGSLDKIVPEGMAQVKLMQQGESLKAPVEIRVVGEDINVLKNVGKQVEAIVKNTKGSLAVHNDYREDYYGVDVHLKKEAERLGFTTESISRMVYTGFSGAAITTMYDGDNPIDIVFRFSENQRHNSDNLADAYVASPVTGASVQLRQIADINPVWHTGRIVRRNGVHTLTVRSETTGDVLPAELLNAVQKQISAIKLPPGYHINYGGEDENKKETFSQMVTALLISLVLIFFILLFQFRNLKEATIVMLTIPLSLFGALFGLYVTGNNFGFTAFVGLISLSGIVVRNAIILVDHTNELLKEGMDIRTAAMESGKRRLRPIFLTAMAAAIGVVPMILSGSPMWSPLASVIAFGVVWSMVTALLTVPVLYIAWIKPKDKQFIMANTKSIIENEK
jgi:multidrug efflux pump subunit AcrB